MSSLYISHTFTNRNRIKAHSQCSLSDLPSLVYQGPSSQELHPYIPLSSLRSLSLTMSRRPLPMYVPLSSLLIQAHSPVEHEGRKEACCRYRDRTGDRRFRQGDCRYVLFFLSPYTSVSSFSSLSLYLAKLRTSLTNSPEHPISRRSQGKGRGS